MSYPNRQQIEIALLKVLVELGGEAKPKDAYPRVAEFFPQLTEAEVNARSHLNKDIKVWWNRVRWAKEDLKNEGCIEGTHKKKDATWRITEKGRTRLKETSVGHAAESPDESRKYLEIFKEHASEWFKKVTFVREYYEFFQEFFKRENLEKAEWSDIQKVGQHLHCFQSIALAKGKALGKPNHPIDHYRRSFIYLAHGEGSPQERIRRFYNDSAYRLDYFGKAAVSELVGYLFPDQFIFVNARDLFAVEFLDIAIAKQTGADLVIEPDKRGKGNAIPLAYSQDADERFYIPENLHLIGMMNTADRSLAMVDYPDDQS